MLINRLKNFTQYKLSFLALCLFIFIYVLSLFAEFIANDKPIVVLYKNKLLFPVVVEYSEKFFDGDFETEADYNESIVKDEIENNGFMIWSPIRWSYDSIDYYLSDNPPTKPSRRHWLGTDDKGRDILARMIYSIRTSISFALILTLVSSTIGIILGSLQGYFGGIFDIIMQRIIEIWDNLPALFIIITVSAIINTTFWWLLLILLLLSWTSLTAYMRAEFLKNRQREYVLSAKLLGIKRREIIFKHILPNSLPPVLSQLPFVITSAILSLVSLDLLGFGLPASSASLGEILLQAKNNPSVPWITFSAVGIITLIIALLVLVADGIREVFKYSE